MTVHTPNLSERRAAMPMQARAATIEARDPAARSVIVCFSSGAAVMRPATDRHGSAYLEILAVSPEAVDLTHMNSGAAPVLDSHSVYATASQLGVVERAWIDGAKAFAEIRFPTAGISPEIDRFVDLVIDGQRRNISVGYSVDRVRVEPAGDGEPERWLVERWTPHELSFVTIPADLGAQVVHARRGIDGADLTFPVVLATPAPTPLDAERQRVADLTQLAGHLAPVDSTRLLADAVRDGITIDAFRVAVLETLADRSDSMHASVTDTAVIFGNDNTAARRAAIENALAHRLGVPGVDLTPHGREYRNVGLSRMMRQALDDAGVSTRGMSDLDVATSTFEKRGMHTVSDFPLALEGALNSRLRTAMDAAVGGISSALAMSSANDFREVNEIEFSEYPDLLPVGEAGEIKFGTMSEGKEKVKAASFARAVTISYQLLLNDNLGAIERAVSQAPGRSAAELKTRLALAALNGSLSDGHPVFHASHGNFGVAAALGVEAIGAGRLAMRQQRGIGSTVPLGIGPSILMVPAELETEAEQILAPIAAATSGTTNPFAGRFELAVEPRLTDPLAWFLFASPDASPVLRFVTLVGHEAPKLETRVEFDRLGISYRVTWHAGCAPIDFRGAYKNPGAADED